MIRCVLPPFGADPDTLRQFEAGGVPQIRLIPVPLPLASNPSPGPAAASTSAATTALQFDNVFQIATQALANSKLALATGGAGATGGPANMPIATGVILAGASFMTSVAMANAFQLLSLTADALCEVRIYGTASSQSFDNVRPVDAPVSAEISSNIISSVSLDTLPYAWGWAGRMGSNQDTPQSSTIYVSVFNTDVVDISNINVTISFLPLES